MAVGKKLGDGELGGRRVHLVQVDIGLDAELAALELLEQLGRVAVAQVRELLAHFQVGGIVVEQQRVRRDGGLVGVAHHRQRRRSRTLRHGLDRFHRPHVADRLAEETAVVLVNRWRATFHGSQS